MPRHRSQMLRSERLRANEQRRQNAGRPNVTGGVSHFLNGGGGVKPSEHSATVTNYGAVVRADQQPTQRFGSDFTGAVHSEVCYDD